MTSYNSIITFFSPYLLIVPPPSFSLLATTSLFSISVSLPLCFRHQFVVFFYIFHTHVNLICLFWFISLFRLPSKSIHIAVNCKINYILWLIIPSYIYIYIYIYMIWCVYIYIYMIWWVYIYIYIYIYTHTHSTTSVLLCLVICWWAPRLLP